ncbi:major pollen allergen Ole e 10-like [Typha angustifolia]|uniref:major pollen allergen Ole e 10-like n=1 Tax=Typha angustifolia TaxID=59011 RepID=UPI003C2DCF18
MNSPPNYSLPILSTIIPISGTLYISSPPFACSSHPFLASASYQMANNSSLLLPFLSLLLLLLHHTAGETTEPATSQHSWCIAKPSTSDVHLIDNIQFACGEIDCSPIQANGSCFYPDTKSSHASVAMNLYYQSAGRNPWNCYFSGTGLIVFNDPSYGKCKYEIGR